MPRGFLYLVSIMDWATRKVLAWRLSNTLDVSFCVDALNEAIAKYGKPDIMNTDRIAVHGCSLDHELDRGLCQNLNGWAGSLSR